MDRASNDDRKRQIALELADLPDICISSQIVNEVVSNVLRKAGGSERYARTLIDKLFADYIVLEILKDDIRTASELREEYRLAYWDSLVVATALRANAETLYSEDMQHGLAIRNRLTIQNPFVLTS